MIQEADVIVMDLDGCLCAPLQPGESYDRLEPVPEVLQKLREYRAKGFYIIIYTARNMRSYQGNLGLINAHTAKQVLAWLDQRQVPYDEIVFGKPWSGRNGFYVDDRAIRPNEFVSMSQEAIAEMLGR